MHNNTLKKYKESQEILTGLKPKPNIKVQKDYLMDKKKHKQNFSMEEDNW